VRQRKYLLHPARKAFLKRLRIQQAEYPSKRIVRLNAVFQLQKLPQKARFGPPILLNLTPTVRPTQYPAHRHDNDLHQAMLAAPFDPWIWYIRELRFQTHEWRLAHRNFFLLF
jgi:hypothetical protein